MGWIHGLQIIRNKIKNGKHVEKTKVDSFQKHYAQRRKEFKRYLINHQLFYFCPRYLMLGLSSTLVLIHIYRNFSTPNSTPIGVPQWGGDLRFNLTPLLLSFEGVL